MSYPDDTEAGSPRPRPTSAAEPPRAPAKGEKTREERLAKALRENLRRRKANARKDQP